MDYPDHRPPRLRWIPPTAWRILMGLLLLGLVYNLVAWLWEQLAK